MNIFFNLLCFGGFDFDLCTLVSLVVDCRLRSLSIDRRRKLPCTDYSTRWTGTMPKRVSIAEGYWSEVAVQKSRETFSGLGLPKNFFFFILMKLFKCAFVQKSLATAVKRTREQFVVQVMGRDTKESTATVGSSSKSIVNPCTERYSAPLSMSGLPSLNASNTDSCTLSKFLNN